MPDIRRYLGTPNSFVLKLEELYDDRVQDILEDVSDELRAELSEEELEDRDQRYTCIAIWDLDREYGGPEEGGWWYTSGRLETSIRFHGKKDLRLWAERIYEILAPKVAEDRPITSVLGGTDYRVTLETRRPEHDYFPVEKPHYE